MRAKGRLPFRDVCAFWKYRSSCESIEIYFSLNATQSILTKFYTFWKITRREALRVEVFPGSFKSGISYDNGIHKQILEGSKRIHFERMRAKGGHMRKNETGLKSGRPQVYDRRSQRFVMYSYVVIRKKH